MISVFTGFQCSSASRKFLNSVRISVEISLLTKFQCSSASRKFLNAERNAEPRALNKFQCSSASRKFLNGIHVADGVAAATEFQCSSASRKFLNPQPAPFVNTQLSVSVLFSEPKIPQSASTCYGWVVGVRFSALQRAENSSMQTTRGNANSASRFQCSSASRKFLNGD